VADFTTSWAVPLFVVATLALWTFDRPGSRPRWRLACLAGLTAAGLALLASQPIGWLWARERPFVAHPRETFLLVPASNEPSFPSDHAVAAFAIACVVACVGRRAGALFLAGATTIALCRVLVGLHYPGDVAGGALIGLASALFVMRFVQRPLGRVAGAVGWLTDPAVALLWSAFDRLRARHAHRTG
jgi:undecaprenyl-diphosphatase